VERRVSIKEFLIRAVMHILIILFGCWSFIAAQSSPYAGMALLYPMIIFKPGMIAIVFIYTPLENLIRSKVYRWIAFIAIPTVSFVLPDLLLFILGWKITDPVNFQFWNWAAVAWGCLWALTGMVYWAFSRD
jgi:hypothetical protein